MSPPEPTPPPASPLDELHALVQELEAYVEWESSRGAWAFPVQRPLATEALASGPAAPPARPAASPARPAASPARPAAPAARPAAAAARPAAPPFSPPAPATPVNEKWAQLASTKALVAETVVGGPASDLDLPLAQALALPQAADRLAAIREVIGDCRRCRLCERRRQVVYGVGDPGARLVVLGEGPGEQEDRQGEPFVGPAGQMLDKMIENVLGLQRGSVYILNMVKCRPPDNRNPQTDELTACRPFLDAQLAALRPDLVLLLGSVASRALLGPGISQTRGRWHRVGWPGGEAPAMATFHPAYLLRKPEDKMLTFKDLKLLRKALDALPARSPAGS